MGRLRRPRHLRLPKRRALTFAAAIVAAAVVLGSCTPRPKGIRLGDMPEGAAAISWPSPPAQARIRFLASISGPRDIGARPTLLRRVITAVTGAASPRVHQPYGIAVDSLGRIFVADVTAQGVHRFDPQRGEYRFITGGRGGLRSPIGVALDSDGDLYVSDSEAGVVVVIGPDERERMRIRAGLERPTGLAWDPARGWLWVADTQRHRIVAFDRMGIERMSIGRRGSGPGEFNFPTNIVVAPDGMLYVSDALNARVQVFARNGEFVRAFGRRGYGVGDMARPKGVALDSEGHVYVVEGLYDVVNIFDSEGRSLLSFGGAGAGPGEFWLATGIAIDREDRVYVADSHNGRIQVMQFVRDAR